MYAAQAASSILIAGDIGGWTTYHTGDEAMLAANIDGLRRLHPAVKITAFSFDPPWTSAHYGVRAIPPIGFWSLPDDDVRRNLWTELERGTADPGPDAARAIDAIADADAVIISGAGNLRAAWPPISTIGRRSSILQNDARSRFSFSARRSDRISIRRTVRFCRQR